MSSLFLLGPWLEGLRTGAGSLTTERAMLLSSGAKLLGQTLTCFTGAFLNVVYLSALGLLLHLVAGRRTFHVCLA